MLYPSIGQYTEAIKLAEQSPEDYFATKTTLRAVLDDNGNPVMSSGNFAVVFKMQDTDGKIFALKCFTRDQEGRNESYRLIADELKDVSSSYITNIQYLEKELFVDTNTDDTEFPVLLMDWVEGETLDKYIKNHISEPLCLEMLACDFAYLADWLLKQPFAHGDLKPDNILVKDDGSLVLIDYDGMYVPKMRGQKARELGSPDFRHPQRTEDDFDEHIDDFAVVTILLSIKALSLNNNLLDTLNAKDCVLLHTQDFSNLAQSAANQKLQELIYDKIFARIYAMFVVILAEKLIDMAMLESVVEKMDRDEAEYQYAQNLYNEGNGSKIELNNAYIHFEKLSARNHVEAQISLALCLLNGNGCIKDINRGFIITSYFADKAKASAQCNLGVCYDNGRGVEQDFNKAVEWYSKAAEQGYARAQFNLGDCYDKGEGVEQDYGKAVEWYTKAAEQGYAIAQHYLGACYAFGDGVEQDYQKAVFWYSKAANQGFADAQYDLGVCVENGYGVEQDYQKAVFWYSKAANQGFADAQFNLGNCYYNGHGVDKNYQKAVEWYTKAADQGDAEAQFKLGYCYFNGEGIDIDYKNAVIWYAKAAEQGDADAQCNLGICYHKGYGIEKDIQKAVEWYIKSAGQGHANAQNRLGICYKYGYGVEQDYIKSFEWLTKSAEQGYAIAQNNLGNCYKNGQGVERDYHKAVEWYTKAAEQGLKQAKYDLNRLNDKMTIL